MPEYLAPGVFVEEVSYRAKSIEGVSTTTTGFVGATRYGPIDIEPDIVTSLVEYERVYGGRQRIEFSDGVVDNYMWNAVRAFFEEGGKRLYVARAFNGDAIKARAEAVGTVPPANVSISARFPGKAGRGRVRLQFVASQNCLGFQGLDKTAVLTNVSHRDVVSRTDTDAAGKTNEGLYSVDRDVQADTWTFTNATGGKFTLVDLKGKDTVSIQVLTASVFFEPEAEGLPFFAAVGLALDTNHRTGGKPDSIFDYFDHEPASLSASRSIPIVISSVKKKEAADKAAIAATEFADATAADNAAQLKLNADTQTATTTTQDAASADLSVAAATIARDAAQAAQAAAQTDVDTPPPGADLVALAATLAAAKEQFKAADKARKDAIPLQTDAQAAAATAADELKKSQAAKDKAAKAKVNAAQKKADADAVLAAATANDTPSGLQLAESYRDDAQPVNRFSSAKLKHVADPANTSVVLDAAYTLSGGGDGSVPNQASFEGKEDPSTNRKSGLVAFEDIEDISIVAAPGSSFANETNAQAIANVLISHAQRMRYRIAVVDSIKGQSIAETRNYRGKFDSTYAAFYYPWVKIIDPETGNENHYPPSGFVAGIYARNDINRAVYKAPANEVVNLALGFEKLLNKSQQEVLNPEGINCFRFFEGRGMRLWGARTMSSDPEWKYVNLRRYFAYLERSIDKGTQWAVFEPNGERLWANVKRTIEDFMLNEWMNGALLGDKPENSFFVKCDRSTMSQNDLDNGRLVCQVGVSALRPAEFVIFRVGQWTADRKA